MPVKEEIHWPTTATAAPPADVLDGPLSVDVLVVGGGLTGCRTALDLARGGATIAVVDARDIGWGASGRSGGQCNPLWRKTPDALMALLGERIGENLIRATLSSADDLFRDVRTHEIDCDAVQAGWVQAAHSFTARKKMRLLGQAWSAAGADISEIEGAEVARVSGSPAYKWALRHAAGGHVHPLSLTRGYARAALRHGAKLFRETPVQRLTRTEGKWVATTPKGRITAENVVLATNGYTDELWSGLRQTFHPLVSISLATEPLSAAQRETVLPGSVTISDSRLAIYYSRYDRDGRLIFGCVGSDDSPRTLGGVQRLRRGLHTVFPQLEGIGIARAWAGRIAVTPEMMPHLHAPAPGVLAGLGFSGRGIAMTSVMGRTLAAKLLGTPDTELPFPVVPVRPLAMHGLTSRLIPLAAPVLTLKDRADGFFGA